MTSSDAGNVSGRTPVGEYLLYITSLTASVLVSNCAIKASQTGSTASSIQGNVKLTLTITFLPFSFASFARSTILSTPSTVVSWYSLPSIALFVLFSQIVSSSKPGVEVK